jgi:hypothetical protein
MKTLWILLSLLLSYSAYGKEFKYIKLYPEFEEYLLRANGKGAQGFLPSEDKASDKEIEGRMREVLLGASRKASLVAKSSPLRGEEPPLYNEIREHLQNSHQQIGLDEITRIDRLNREFNLGKENFSGFSWQKPFGTVQVHVDRQVTPNLYTEGPHDQWLIQDTFSFEVEATTFLESLRQEKLAHMSEREVGAFAGVTFKRVYTYYHYAPSYQAGLTADLSKLFLPFTRFNQKGIENLAHNEIIKREDKFTAKAGGLITTPPIYNISFSAGILAEADMELMTSVQGIHTADPNGRRFTIGSRGKSTKKTGAVLQLQLDFFKLLKLTLIRAEMSYEYTKSKEFTLGFTPSQWQGALAKSDTADELKSLWRGFTEIRDLEPYVIRLEEGQSESIETYGNILLWGRMDKSKHETNRIIKDGEVHLFHKTYMQDTKFVENLLSRIFSEFIYKLLKLPMGTKNVAIYDKRLTMEYKANHPQAENSNIQRVRSAEDLSFKITRSLEVASKSYINDAVWFVSEFTSLPSSYKSDLKKGRLKTPVRLESHLRVDKEGFKYFQSRSTKDIFGSLVKVCKSKNLSKWQDEVERIRMLKANHSNKEDSCVQVMGSLFMVYLNDYNAYYEMPSLAHFRNFLMEYINSCEKITDLNELFGEKNVFLNGEITAKFPNGAHFRDVFSRGQFRGYGVIDNFKRAGGTGTPASITSE